MHVLRSLPGRRQLPADTAPEMSAELQALMDTAPEKPRPPPPLAVPTGIPSENHRIVTSGYIDPSVAIEIAPSRRTTTGRASNVSFRDVQEGSSNAFIASESFRVGSPPPSMPVVRLSTQLEALEA